MFSRIKEIGRVVTGKTPPAERPDHFGREIPFLTPSDMKGSRRVETTERALSEAGTKAFRRLIVSEAIGVSCIGWQMGKSIIIQKPVVTNQQINSIVPHKNKVDLLFLYYSLLLRREELFRLASGGSRTPILKKSLFEEVEIWLPSLQMQSAIARVLDALDNRIELHAKMNHTLESMASSLFKSWFVDFDPIVAKAEGGKPFAMDEATAALFPTSFQEISGQSIPLGWSLGTLGDLIELKRGFDLPTQERRQGKIPIVSSSGFSGTHSTAMVMPPGIVTGRYGTIGQVYYVDEPFWPLNTTLFVENYKNTFSWFAYHCLSRVDFHAYADKAAVPGINRNHVHTEPIVYPPISLQERFHQFAETLWRKRKHNQLQNRLLAEMRDTLLPMLISGEIGLKDAEKLVGEAT